jgi:hypothetical protein
LVIGFDKVLPRSLASKTGKCHKSLQVDGVVGMNTWHALMAQLGLDSNNCNRSGWCNYNVSGFSDQFRMWVPTTIWYVVGLSGKFVQMNTGGPN